MLDHGRTLDDCRKAIDLGFTDIMYDGSALPFDENLANTRAIVEEAHALDIAVEAELGHVGSDHDYQAYGARGKGFTDPKAVVEFVRETGVDFLAIAVGTAHGQYDGEPLIDLDLLGEIRERVDIPLVLHGGSGLSEQQFRDAIGAGIAKINIATDLFVAAGQAVAETVAQGKTSYHAITAASRDSFQERCAWFIDLFSSP
ncbi:MAG TPA: class II fructose-bisphosphate aldolase [Armatimonadota bacterium]|nr:class II fructose-bisphosphate aldolase [Armatimonadota bacterium]